MAARPKIKRINRARNLTAARNLEERQELIKEIRDLCKTIRERQKPIIRDPLMPRALDENSDVSMEDANDPSIREIELLTEHEEQDRHLAKLWAQHGYLLTELAKGSKININEFLEAFFLTFKLGDNTRAMEFAADNLEIVMDQVRLSLVPLITSIVTKIRHYVKDPTLFYDLLTRVTLRYGIYLTIYAEFDKFLKEFEENGELEVLNLLAAIIRTSGASLKPQSLQRLLDQLNKDKRLTTSVCFLRVLNELLTLYVDKLPIKETAERVLKHTKFHIYTDPDYELELEKCRQLYAARVPFP